MNLFVTIYLKVALIKKIEKLLSPKNKTSESLPIFMTKSLKILKNI